MTPSIFRPNTNVPALHDLYRKVLDRRPVPRTELRIPTREGETFVIGFGRLESPPLLLLHGSQANATRLRGGRPQVERRSSAAIPSFTSISANPIPLQSIHPGNS
jgi:hypothetical protein